MEQEKSAGEETPAGDSLARPPHLRPHRRHRPHRQELRAKQCESARKCSQVSSDKISQFTNYAGEHFYLFANNPESECGSNIEGCG